MVMDRTGVGVSNGEDLYRHALPFEAKNFVKDESLGQTRPGFDDVRH
jgi:hypothetical protein